MIIVVFKHRPRAGVNLQEYDQFIKDLYLLGKQIPGFLSVSEYSAENGDRVAIEHFATMQALEQWRAFPEHIRMIQLGWERFYGSYTAQVCTTVSSVSWSVDSPVVKEEKG
ncbi:hypothetical protein EPA93_09375 [Ktedonosporobacter rubrisoli]|uniref:Antibiotic biosynthesis monooxygenase n=1 Tax=Ktedonosporobacter rubrisoli TaxID=2509675 RepID=A0A4P6JMC8_KTERU|nr:hypothetical protein [Ktedonosporobacter rubrisoli]QBD76210.1 hypothetical protein EPA93_09375 [Ktedonosporobacter rubrisoli]